MTLAPEFLPIARKSWFAPIAPLTDWLRRRQARRRHIEALRGLVASPDWLLDDIGVSRDDLRSDLDAAERGDTRRATESNSSRKPCNQKGSGQAG